VADHAALIASGRARRKPQRTCARSCILTTPSICLSSSLQPSWPCPPATSAHSVTSFQYPRSFLPSSLPCSHCGYARRQHERRDRQRRGDSGDCRWPHPLLRGAGRLPPGGELLWLLPRENDNAFCKALVPLLSKLSDGWPPAARRCAVAVEGRAGKGAPVQITARRPVSSDAQTW